MGIELKRVLTIAGSDSSGGAGVQADMRVFAEMGVYGMCAVTAVTAQNSLGVQKVEKIAPRIVAAQIDSCVRDIGVDACKIGMLYSHQIVNSVSERLRRREIKRVVLDPVTFAKDGTRLLLSKAVDCMKRQLLPLCELVAPNLEEAGLLSGIEVKDVSSAVDAAKAIFAMGSKNVLVKGGHFAGEPVDILFDGENVHRFSGRRIEGRVMHGTGCVLTAAIAARLALGESVYDAVKFAKDYVEQAIRSSVELGKGRLYYFNGTGGGFR